MFFLNLENKKSKQFLIGISNGTTHKENHALWHFQNNTGFQQGVALSFHFPIHVFHSVQIKIIILLWQGGELDDVFISQIIWFMLFNKSLVGERSKTVFLSTPNQFPIHCAKNRSNITVVTLVFP